MFTTVRFSGSYTAHYGFIWYNLTKCTIASSEETYELEKLRHVYIGAAIEGNEENCNVLT